MTPEQRATVAATKCKGGMPAKKMHKPSDKHWKALACVDCIAAALTPSEAVKEFIQASTDLRHYYEALLDYLPATAKWETVVAKDFDTALVAVREELGL